MEMNRQDDKPCRPIYMDHHATTPIDPRVLKTMLPYFTEAFGNASSTDHEYGAIAHQAVETAREQVAALIGARSEEIIFTSGATEADNLAILGVAEQYRDRGDHIITCMTEHPAVLDTCRYLERTGFRVTYLRVDQYGMVDPDEVRQAITLDTILVSIMMANNEIGTIAPIHEIGRITKERGVLFHTDATQCVGYIPIDVEQMSIDLLSMSAHKVYGAKGTGALYVRKLRPRVRLIQQQHGGGHERGMRSGTLNVPGIVGMGKALDLAHIEMTEESQRLLWLRDKLWQGLQAEIEDVHLNGHFSQRIPHNLNIAIADVEARSLIVQLRHEVAFSTGSACTTTKTNPSHVILATGYSAERAHNSARFGLGRSNSLDEVETVVQTVANKVNHLRKLRIKC